MDEFELEKAPLQTGKIAVVTGSNVGLGFETAVGLSEKGAHVILACRNLKKADEAKKLILNRVPDASLETMALDLSSLKSVREFSAMFLDKFDRLDILINNAGIMMSPFSLTEDGFESQIGVNHFGHFLLTGLLLPLIESTESSRVVSLSSLAHRRGKIKFPDINSENGYSRMGAYSQSKLACLMFTYELQRRFEQTDSNSISVAAHPGASNTELSRHLPSFVRAVAPILFSLVTHSIKDGAMPTLYAAIGQDVNGGDYFGPTGFYEMKGKAGKVESTPASHDEAVAAKLWTLSEEMTGLSYL